MVMCLTKACLIWLAAMIWIPALALGQTAVLHGSVTDVAGAPLIGANVSIDELVLGSATDIEGEYNFVVPAEFVTGQSVTMRAQFIGYRTVTRVITLRAGDQVQSFVLAFDPLKLEEVVVTGIASERSRATAEVSVARINTSKYLEQNAYQSVAQLMTGKAAGVSVQPSTGNIGGGIRFIMRSSTGLNGNGQPVIYVDGVRIDQDEVLGVDVGGQGVSMLAMLNPEEIESIDVLKGPAGAASYGTSGSNGVILITTKRGQLAADGTAPVRVTYKGVLGSNQQAEKYTLDTAAVPDTVNSFFDDGTIKQHSLSVAGGSKTIRYYMSFDLRDEEAHIIGSYQDRKSFRANIEAFPTSRLQLRVNTNYIVNDIRRPHGDNSILGPLGAGGIIPQAFPFATREAINGLTNVQHVSRFLGSFQAEYSPMDDLVLKASIGFDATDSRNDQTVPSNFFYPGVVFGQRDVFNRRNEQSTYDLNARYSYQVTDAIRATSIIGSQLFDRDTRTSVLTKQNFSTDLITNIGAGADLVAGDEFFLHSREAGIYAQQEFSVGQKYFATLGLRRDYASAIGADAPSIWYPKISAAVRLDQVTELPEFLSFLKVRTAYGETGQLPGVLDKSFLRWSAEPSGYGAGAVTNFIGNVDIEPERIKEFEVGFEAELLTNVGLDVTYYRQTAKNSIIPFQHAPSTGLTASPVPFNVGASTGWGFETALSAAILQKRDFGVDLTLIWNYQTNEVDDLGGAQPIFDGFDINVIKEGLPRDAFYTWSSRATFASDGTYTGAELTTSDDDGDGEPDRTNFGTPYPDHSGSFALNIRAFKYLSVGVLTDWMLGNHVFNGTRELRAIVGGLQSRNEAMVALGLVPAEAFGLEDENIPILEPGTDAYRRTAEFVGSTEPFVEGVEARGNFIEAADFFKLREVSIRYDLTHLLSGVSADRHIRTLSFTLAARNLWTTTKYSGTDPEGSFQGASSTTRSWDFLVLPQPRVIYAMISIGL